MIEIILTYVTAKYPMLILEMFTGFLYYLFNEFEDRSVRNKWGKYQQFLNTGLSWHNKWKLDGMLKPLPYVSKWYHFGVKPSHEERFAYSSTILVFVTDGEHLFQSLKHLFILAGIAIISWQFMLAFLVGRLIMSFIKEAFIKWLQ